MNKEAVMNILHKRKDRLGSWAALAEELKVSPAYLSDCVNGRRDLGKSILKGLGLKAVTVYERER
jgi:hypothetical protein